MSSSRWHTWVKTSWWEAPSPRQGEFQWRGSFSCNMWWQVKFNDVMIKNRMKIDGTFQILIIFIIYQVFCFYYLTTFKWFNQNHAPKNHTKIRGKFINLKLFLYFVKLSISLYSAINLFMLHHWTSWKGNTRSVLCHLEVVLDSFTWILFRKDTALKILRNNRFHQEYAPVKFLNFGNIYLV